MKMHPVQAVLVFFGIVALVDAGCTLSGTLIPFPWRSAEAAPPDTFFNCIHLGEGYCDLDTFQVDGHTCVRWHKAQGSDMECWETVP